ncbi:hypothetical protein D3C75_987620 [compost metagenome]
MAASMPGSGWPIEPGLIAMAAVLASMIPPVSVCHQLSWIGRPSTSLPHHTASGLSGSPTLATKRRAGYLCARASWSPALISRRMAVGAVYQTLTCSLLRMPYQRTASKSAQSTTLVTPSSSGARMP